MTEAWREGLVQLGPDWVMGSDGVPYRQAARVIVVDRDDRVLMARGHDVDEPERHWWFTVGGGIDAGEDARSAAVRELREETGLELDAGALEGPVIRRTALFDFAARTVRQDEEFYLARFDGPTDGFDTSGWTSVEIQFMDELRWWDLDGLESQDETVYPVGFTGLLRTLLDGWDGVVIELEEAE